MGNTIPFAQVLDGLTAGHPSAAEAVVRETFGRIVGLVRKRIGRRYTGKVDAEDIANSAFKSFFRRQRDKPYALADWKDVWNLLVEIAACKLSNSIRAYNRLCRTPADAERERQAQADGTRPPPTTPTPDEQVVIDDLLAHLLGGYTDAERQMIELSLEGCEVAEIAARVGFSERTVIRVRKTFQARLEASIAEKDEVG